MLLVNIALAVAMAAGPQVTAPQNDIPANLRPEYVAMVDSAARYIRIEDWESARKWTLEAMRSDPGNFNNSMLFSNLGIIDMNLGRIDDAIENFSLGLTIAPRSTTLLANRVRAYLTAGRDSEADADLLKLLEFTPDDVWALKMHGILLARAGDNARAAETFAKIPEPDSDTLRTMAMLALSAGNTEAALVYYDRLVEDFPTDETFYDRALFLITVDRNSEAADDIRRGLELNPRNGNLYLLRAYLHKLMHENSLAELDKKMARDNNADAELFNQFFPEKKKKR